MATKRANNTIRPTRFARLGYRCDGPGLWRVYDRDGDAAVGPLYTTKAELLADLERYAGVFGVHGETVPFVDVQYETCGDGPRLRLSHVVRVF